MADFQVRLGTTSTIATNGSGTEGSTMITVPISSTYKTTSTTLVNQGRNTSGVLKISVVRAGIRKIELGYNVISNSDYSKLAKFFNTNFTFYAYYFDQDNNTWETRQFYVGDRVADSVKNIQWTQNTGVGGNIAPKYVGNFKLSLIEL